jgi:quinol monooxygenase YgiN
MLRAFAIVGFAGGFAMTMLGPGAVAQETGFYTATYIEVGPVLAKVGAAALNSYREAARKEAASLDVYQRIDRPNQFVVLGAWGDQKAFEAHAAGDNSKKLNEKLSTLLASPNDTRTHTGLSVSPAKAVKDAIIVVTHVDVVPPEKDKAADALEQLADSSRNHIGNLQFDVWRQSSRPNHFTVVESWANRGSFDVHQMQTHTREFRLKLGPMAGALYDERLYKVMP